MGGRKGGLTWAVFNIQRYSIHDGPGIRTTVFLKGYSLGISGARIPNLKACIRSLFRRINVPYVVGYPSV